ncbi:uncharacterized protein LACBIDRAFT_331620, partial [Laccaria bicolor S238N-H82]
CNEEESPLTTLLPPQPGAEIPSSKCDQFHPPNFAAILLVLSQVYLGTALPTHRRGDSLTDPSKIALLLQSPRQNSNPPPPAPRPLPPIPVQNPVQAVLTLNQSLNLHMQVALFHLQRAKQRH